MSSPNILFFFLSLSLFSIFFFLSLFFYLSILFSPCSLVGVVHFCYPKRSQKSGKTISPTAELRFLVISSFLNFWCFRNFRKFEKKKFSRIVGFWAKIYIGLKSNNNDTTSNFQDPFSIESLNFSKFEDKKISYKLFIVSSFS